MHFLDDLRSVLDDLRSILDDLQSVLDDLGTRLDDHFMRKSSEQLAVSNWLKANPQCSGTLYLKWDGETSRVVIARKCPTLACAGFAEVRHCK